MMPQCSAMPLSVRYLSRLFTPTNTHDHSLLPHLASYVPLRSWKHLGEGGDDPDSMSTASFPSSPRPTSDEEVERESDDEDQRGKVNADSSDDEGSQVADPGHTSSNLGSMRGKAAYLKAMAEEVSRKK